MIMIMVLVIIIIMMILLINIRILIPFFWSISYLTKTLRTQTFSNFKSRLQMVRRQNSTTAEEVARFQGIFTNPSWLTACRKNIRSPKLCLNIPRETVGMLYLLLLCCLLLYPNLKIFSINLIFHLFAWVNVRVVPGLSIHSIVFSFTI